jgi:putative transposase
MIDTAVVELTPIVGAKAACDAVGRSRASHYRAHPAGPVLHGPAPTPAAAVRRGRSMRMPVDWPSSSWCASATVLTR